MKRLNKNRINQGALAAGTFAAMLCLAAQAARCDTPPPMNGMSQRTVYTPNPDVDGDAQGQGGVVEQWNGSGTTRNSLDQVLKGLSAAPENKVEHRVTRYPGGEKKSTESVVTSKLPGKRLLYAATDQWSPSGKLLSTFRQVDTLDSSGIQVNGRRVSVTFSHERVSSEKREKWDPSFRGWLETYRSAMTYDAQGGLAQRTTTLPPLNRKTRETWAPGTGPDRDKTTQVWDESAHRWNDL